MSKFLGRGIDVSSHQKTIDWAKVKASGKVDFVLIRIGYRGSKNGVLTEDSQFQNNIKGAVKNNIKIGGYFFSTAKNKAEAIEEANFCIERMKQYNVAFPIVYDLEGYEKPTYRSFGISKQTRTDNCKAFNERMAEYGYTTLIYGSRTNIKNKFYLDQLADQKLWVAAYRNADKAKEWPTTDKPVVSGYSDKIALWQFSSTGKIDGISTVVDLNVMYIDIETKKDNSVKPVVTENTVTVTLPILKYGSKGSEVSTLQVLLNAKGYKGKDGKTLVVDGKFGPNVRYAVYQYQVDHVEECGTADYIVGLNFWNSILK